MHRNPPSFKFTLLLALSSLPGLLATNSSAQEMTVAEDAAIDHFVIRNDVLVEDPARFGTNIPWVFSFKPWTNNRFINVWSEQFSFEPFEARHEIRVPDNYSEESTPNSFHFAWKQGQYGISKWGQYPSGVYTGGHVDIFRETEDSFERIHRSKITTWFADRGTDQGRRFDEGYLEWETPLPRQYGTVQAGDLMVFTHFLTDPEAITCTHQVSQNKKDGWLSRSDRSKVRWLIDTSTQAPEGNSTASMKITVSGGDGKPQGMRHFFINQAGEPEGTGPAGRLSKLQFREGEDYRLELWLRGERSGQTVRVALGKFLDENIRLSTRWEQYSFDLPREQRSDIGVGNNVYPDLFIGSEEDGTFWVDNFMLHEVGTPPFALLDYAKKALKDLRPGHVRAWASYLNRTIESSLSANYTATGMFRGDRFNAANGMTLASEIKLVKDLESIPWLPIWGLINDEEIEFLMEYLGGDASTPGGQLRASQGQHEPWTSVFETIYLECNNEAWNQPFNIAGSNRSGVLYGKIANRMFRLIKASPHYDSDKFRLVLNGDKTRPYRVPNWQGGGWKEGPDGEFWTLQALRVCTEAELVDWGVYYGGADGLTVLGEDDKELYQNQMLYNKRIAEPQIFNPALELIEEIRRTQGREIGLATYESGPGYPIPSPAKPFTAAGELMGKSLAMGVLTMDAFMRQQRDGYESMCYYLFDTGNNWASHRSMNDMTPYPSWMAIEMRNQHCEGDLLKVDVVSRKTHDFAAFTVEKMNWDNTRVVERTVKATDNVPWVECYAFREGDRYSYILYNLSYDEPRPIRMDLPYRPSAEATAYMMHEADPRATNRHEDQVDIDTFQIENFSQRFEFTLPPSSVMVIVNQAAR